MALRVGVVFSGCGYLDGSEIHEAVSILIALDRRGAQVLCFAPDAPQSQVIDHRDGKAQAEGRNMLAESARIARGRIADLATAHPDDLDALIFPGGFGAARNLCDYATKGKDCTVLAAVAKLLLGMHQQNKPIGLACIAPVLAAAVLGRAGKRPELTLGTDEANARGIEALGAVHHNTPPADICIDQGNKLVSTPCYMNAVGPWIVYQGAEKMVEAVLLMAGDPAGMIRQKMSGDSGGQGAR